MTKLTREQKAAINEVIKRRYPPKALQVIGYGMLAVPGVFVGLLLDLAFTAGFGTVLAISTGTLPALAGYTHVRNTFGSQKTRSGEKLSAHYRRVAYTAATIEFSVEASYITNVINKPPGPDEEPPYKPVIVPPEEKLRKFLKDVEEAEKDIKTLSIAFKTASGQALTPLISKTGRNVKPRYMITFEEAKAEALEKLHAIENPPSPPPPPAKKKMGFELG